MYARTCMGQRAAGARSLLDVACKHSGSRPQLLIAEVGSGHVVSVGVPQASAGDAHALATMLAQHHMHNVFIPGEVQLWGVSRQASREDRECCKRSHGCRTVGQASPQRPRSRMHTPLSLFLSVSLTPFIPIPHSYEYEFPIFVLGYNKR